MPAQYICQHCQSAFTDKPSHPRSFCTVACWRQDQRDRASHSIEARFWSYVDTSGECWIWRGGRTSKGYGGFALKHGKSIPAHRFAYELVHGPIPPGLFACHRCDVPACVRPNHIFAGTHAENMADRNAKGRQARSERHPNSRLNEEQVETIRSWYATGNVTMKSLAREFGVSQRAIACVIHEINWRPYR